MTLAVASLLRSAILKQNHFCILVMLFFLFFNVFYSIQILCNLFFLFITTNFCRGPCGTTESVLLSREGEKKRFILCKILLFLLLRETRKKFPQNFYLCKKTLRFPRILLSESLCSEKTLITNLNNIKRSSKPVCHESKCFCFDSHSKRAGLIVLQLVFID